MMNPKEKEILKKVAQKHNIPESVFEKILTEGQKLSYSDKSNRVRQDELLKEITFYFNNSEW
ncbi:DNA modification system-associated small protein [Salisediminibacterium beveridgei]|uniref:Uncharacterized protein n=1 Tax=Salisediminibacterium beveridgei TaxID=632773 RepID=A0A1D7QWY9_9BACI|nr:DNA modification system-associated small protein [Salisediminibacterium beveridgei]AOM83527.1 hypothetical protein BBEV_2169 [Salisediminibacterium beveridgei]